MRRVAAEQRKGPMMMCLELCTYCKFVIPEKALHGTAEILFELNCRFLEARTTTTRALTNDRRNPNRRTIYTK